MQRSEILEQLKFLFDQVHQTAERAEHLNERLAMPIKPQSLNYEKDLTRFQGDYNRLARLAEVEGILTAADLQEQGLPAQFED